MKFISSIIQSLLLAAICEGGLKHDIDYALKLENLL